MTQCNCKNTDELRIVRGNAFAIRLTVSAIHIDGTPVENFVLGDSEAVLKVMHLDEKTSKEFLIIGNDAIINFGGDLSLGWYGFEMTGTFNGKPWRWCVHQVFQVVETNAKANIPAWAVLTDETYAITGVMTITSGDIYQSDWNETDPQSPSYIKNKPDVVLHPEFNETVQRIERDIDDEETRAKGAERDLATAIGNEETRAKGAEQTLQEHIDAEALARGNADTTLQGNIDAEETRAKAAEKQNADDIDAIEEKIPTQASAQNQLADKQFVNSSISTATATYRGAYNLVSDLELTTAATEQQIAAALATKMTALGITPDNNDYCFVQVPTADATPTEIARVDRYKFNGTAWAFEYSLNKSGFTAAQWAALNSGITSGLVAKLGDLPTNSELTTLLNGKQDTISDLSDIRSGAAAGATAYQKPSGGIPKSDLEQSVQNSLSRADEAVVANGSGTSGQVLTSRGSGQEPVWQTGELVHPVTDVSGTAAVTTSGHYYSAKWAGQCEGITALRDGMMVNIKIPVQGNATYHTVLNINGLGEHPVCRNVTNEADVYVADSIITLIYDANAQAPAYFDSSTATTVTGVWKIGDYDSQNTYQLRHASNAGTFIAATNLPEGVICLQKNETTLLPINATGGTGTSKVLTTESFNPFGAIVYVKGNYSANDNISSNVIFEQSLFDLRISFNTGSTLTNNKDVYICAVPQSDGMAKLDATTPIVQELPSADDGKIYIYIGHIGSSSKFELHPVHPVYWFKGGKIVPYTVLDISAKADKSYVDEKFLSKCVSITYAELKALRDNSQLVAGQWYRITDYVTTTAQADTQSAGHQFDVIVMALENGRLSEVAFAAQHSGDTYFNGAQLEAWELRYCLDNDTTRFAWADSTNGKGVIYWMKDQNGNECPYDFKNIQFKRCPMTGQVVISEANYADDLMVARCARMTELIGSSVTKDTYSIRLGFMGDNPVLGSTLSDNYVDAEGTAAVIDTEAYYLPLNIPIQAGKILFCKVGEPVFFYTFDLKGNETSSDISLTDSAICSNKIAGYYINGLQTLNNIIFAVYETSSNYALYSNSFSEGSCSMTWGQYAYENVIGHQGGNLIIGHGAYQNKLGAQCQNNIFGKGFSMCFAYNSSFAGNIGGSDFRQNVFLGPNNIRNVFGNNSYTNVIKILQTSILGNNSQRNEFGMANIRHRLGNNVVECKFEDGVQEIVYNGSYLMGSTFEQENIRITINCTDTTSSSMQCRYLHFRAGTKIGDMAQFNAPATSLSTAHPIIFQRAATEIIEV